MDNRFVPRASANDYQQVYYFMGSVEELVKLGYRRASPTANDTEFYWEKC